MVWPLLVARSSSRSAAGVAARARPPRVGRARGRVVRRGRRSSLRPDNPSRVYYGTDTRVASILIGAALAAWLALRARSTRAASAPGSRSSRSRASRCCCSRGRASRVRRLPVPRRAVRVRGRDRARDRGRGAPPAGVRSIGCSRSAVVCAGADQLRRVPLALADLRRARSVAGASRRLAAARPADLDDDCRRARVVPIRRAADPAWHRRVGRATRSHRVVRERRPRSRSSLRPSSWPPRARPRRRH